MAPTLAQTFFFEKFLSPTSSCDEQDMEDLNRHFKVRTHPILDPILPHPILKSGGLTRIRVGVAKSGGKSGG